MMTREEKRRKGEAESTKRREDQVEERERRSVYV